MSPDSDFDLVHYYNYSSDTSFYLLTCLGLPAVLYGNVYVYLISEGFF